jgi:hypothetical protein
MEKQDTFFENDFERVVAPILFAVILGIFGYLLWFNTTVVQPQKVNNGLGTRDAINQICRNAGGIPYRAGRGATWVCVDKDFKIILELE